MARPLRLAFAGGVYHITSRGNERQTIIRDDADRTRFMDILGVMVKQYGVICHAWVLMDNHYHLLLETPTPNLSRAVRHLNGVYTQGFNRRHGRVGHLFQGRFKAIIVEKDAYLLELSRYVVLNPVRAGLVRDPATYTWSSYRPTAGLTPPPPWLTIDWLLEQFGRRRRSAQAAYQRFVLEGIRLTQTPWEHVVGQIYLGGQAFIRRARGANQNRQDSEIPHQQREPTWLTFEEVLIRIAEWYGVSVAALEQPTRRPSEARQVALYGLRRWARADLTAIASRMGVHYSAVSRRIGLVALRLTEDRSFRERVEALSNVKIKT